jgi:hypothetical protein
VKKGVSLLRDRMHPHKLRSVDDYSYGFLTFANLRTVTQTSLAPSWSVPDLEPALLDEERVRNQLSAAEELHYVGHTEPTLIAAGAALAGVLRLRGGPLAGNSASGGALLEALLATRTLSAADHELLYRLLRAHHSLTHGYAPDPDAALAQSETSDALALMVRLLEGLDRGPTAG